MDDRNADGPDRTEIEAQLAPMIEAGARRRMQELRDEHGLDPAAAREQTRYWTQRIAARLYHSSALGVRAAVRESRTRP